MTNIVLMIVSIIAGAHGSAAPEIVLKQPMPESECVEIKRDFESAALKVSCGVETK